MSFRYGVLSLFLFFTVLLLSYENYRVWSTPALPASKKVAETKAEGKNELLSGAPGPGETAPREAFGVIAENNLFHPDRKEFPSQSGAAMVKPVARPTVTLYGVVMAGEHESATIVNPGRPLHKGEREAKTIKVGDMVGDYKLAKILPDRIVMEGGEDSFEVLLYDPRTPKKRVAVTTPAPPAKVTSPVPGPTAPAGMPAVPPPVIAPAPGGSPTPAPLPVTPVPVPRTTAQPPGGIYQPPSQVPASTPSPAVPDPGLWRGRRPVSPGGSSE